MVFAVVVAFSAYALFSPPSDDEELFRYVDKVVHVAIFAALAASGRWALGPRPLLLALLVLYAPLSEVLQASVFDRDGGWEDAVADLLGLALGWWSVGRLSGGR